MADELIQNLPPVSVLLPYQALCEPMEWTATALAGYSRDLLGKD